MWKYLFEIGDRLFSIVPVKKWRDWLQTVLLFDYRRKLDALKLICHDFDFNKMHLAKGGGAIVFIINNEWTYKVRKRNTETIKFERFIREKRVLDAIRPFCSITIPEIDFVEQNGFMFYKSKFIPGKLLVNVSSKRIKKYQDKISQQLAEFIYKKSFADPIEIEDLRNTPSKSGFSWNHTDMCSNILVDEKTMRITGIIDWEWAAYSETENEFRGLVWVRKKMQKIGLDKTTRAEYEKILKAAKPAN